MTQLGDLLLYRSEAFKEKQKIREESQRIKQEMAVRFVRDNPGISKMEMAAEINEALKKLRNGNHDLEATIKYIKLWIPYVDAQHDKNLEMLHQGVDSCLEQVMQSQKTLSELQSLLIK